MLTWSAFFCLRAPSHAPLGKGELCKAGVWKAGWAEAVGHAGGCGSAHHPRGREEPPDERVSVTDQLQPWAGCHLRQYPEGLLISQHGVHGHKLNHIWHTQHHRSQTKRCNNPGGTLLLFHALHWINNYRRGKKSKSLYMKWLKIRKSSIIKKEDVHCLKLQSLSPHSSFSFVSFSPK